MQKSTAAVQHGNPPQGAFLNDMRRNALRSGSEPRPLSYWLAKHRPGWVSRYSAEAANPLARAADIHALCKAFLQWRRRPQPERWDTYLRQSLSAALFNRYRSDIRTGSGKRAGSDLELLELDWPTGSDEVQRQLARLQELLAAPFAVFKAVRSAVGAEEFPSAGELKLAEAAIGAQLEELERCTALLGEALP